MALDPSDRYDDLEDLRTELGRLRAEIAGRGRAISSVAIVSERIIQRRGALVWLVSVGAATALAAAGAAFWIYGTADSL